MKFGDWANSRIKKLKWFDASLAKISVIGFSLMIAKLWTPILSLEWYWYAAIFILAMIVPLYNVSKK